MSSIKLESNASGTGIFTIASPNSNTNRTLTLPDATGTIITTAGGAAISGTTGAFTSTVGVGGATPAASGAGITFPATQSASSDANTLDDYEEGTWTATVFDASTGGNQSSTTSTGYYTKIGDMVFFAFNLPNISTAGLTSGNGAYFTLPFTSSDTANKNNCSMVNALIQGVNWTDSRTDVQSFLGTSATRFLFYVQGDNVTYSFITVGNITNGSNVFYVSGFYRV